MIIFSQPSLFHLLFYNLLSNILYLLLEFLHYRKHILYFSFCREILITIFIVQIVQCVWCTLINCLGSLSLSSFLNFNICNWYVNISLSILTYILKNREEEDGGNCLNGLFEKNIVLRRYQKYLLQKFSNLRDTFLSIRSSSSMTYLGNNYNYRLQSKVIVFV